MSIKYYDPKKMGKKKRDGEDKKGEKTINAKPVDKEKIALNLEGFSLHLKMWAEIRRKQTEC